MTELSPLAKQIKARINAMAAERAAVTEERYSRDIVTGFGKGVAEVASQMPDAQIERLMQRINDGKAATVEQIKQWIDDHYEPEQTFGGNASEPVRETRLGRSVRRGVSFLLGGADAEVSTSQPSRMR